MSRISEWDQPVAKIATLKKEVQKQRDARMRMEEILTYVENQNATLHAALPATPRAAMPPTAASATVSTLFGSEPPTQHCQCNKVKIIWIPDPPTFYAEPQKNQILYEDWHFQMLNKMAANKLTMPMEVIKLVYVQSFTADNAFAQIRPRLGPNAARPFRTASEIFKMLTAAFGNANQKQEAWTQYCSLRQGTRNFKSF